MILWPPCYWTELPLVVDICMPRHHSPPLNYFFLFWCTLALLRHTLGIISRSRVLKIVRRVFDCLAPLSFRQPSNPLTMKPPSEPPLFRNFHYEYCDLPSMTMPQVGADAQAGEVLQAGEHANAGMASVDGCVTLLYEKCKLLVLTYPRISLPLSSRLKFYGTATPTLTSRPPSTNEPILAPSGPSVVPRSLVSTGTLLPIRYSTPSCEMLTFNADPCSSSWSSFPPSAFQYSSWPREQGETQPNDLSLSLSPLLPASQDLNKGQGGMQGYTQGAPTTFATVPMRQIKYDCIDTKTPTFSTAMVPPLIPDWQGTDIVSISRYRKSSLVKGADAGRWVCLEHQYHRTP